MQSGDAQHARWQSDSEAARVAPDGPPVAAVAGVPTRSWLGNVRNSVAGHAACAEPVSETVGIAVSDTEGDGVSDGEEDDESAAEGVHEGDAGGDGSIDDEAGRDAVGVTIGSHEIDTRPALSLSPALLILNGDDVTCAQGRLRIEPRRRPWAQDVPPAPADTPPCHPPPPAPVPL